VSDAGRTKGLRLQHQLTLCSLLPVALLGAVATLVSIYALRQISLTLILQRNTALVRVAANGLANDLNGYLCPLQTVAEVLADHAADTAHQEQILQDWAPFLQPFEGGVALLDKTGIVIATTPGHEQRTGYDYSFQDYFQAAQITRRPVFSAVLKEKPSGQDTVVIATPALHGDDFSGVLIGVLFLGRHPWTDHLEPLRTQQGGQAYLIDTSGTVIYHPDITRIGGTIRGTEPLWRLVAAGQPDSTVRDSRFFGEQVVTSFAPLPGVGWGLLMNEPTSALLAPTVPYKWAVGGLLAGGVLLSMAVLIISVGRVTRPLTGLVQEARQVSAGVPFRPLEAQGPPEIRTLISAFNYMVIRLAEQQATLRQYALQVLQSQEEERKRISRELHDETVQDLVGLVQRIELCRSAVEQDPAAASRRLDELQSLAEAALADVRRISNDLRPLILEDLGLPAALQALSEDLSQHMPDARVHCEIVGDERRLAPELELTVFRVVQEALTNVRRHARSATQVNVTLYFEEEQVLATVEDNGPGFPPPDVRRLVRQNHVGLAGMYERAHLFDGEASITSTPGKGTTAVLRLPSQSTPA
jgi:signal transduction histidine kinase